MMIMMNKGENQATNVNEYRRVWTLEANEKDFFTDLFFTFISENDGDLDKVRKQCFELYWSVGRSIYIH